MERAQELLHELQRLDIPNLYNNHYQKAERLDRIKVVKQKMKVIEKSVKGEKATIEARYDGRNTTEAQLEKIGILPYRVLLDLIDQLEISIKELENAIKYDSPIPDTPQFGSFLLKTTMFNNMKIEVVTFEDALNYYRDQGKEVKGRLDATKLEASKQLESVRKEKPSIIKAIFSTQVFLALLFVSPCLYWDYRDGFYCVSAMFLPMFSAIGIFLAYRVQRKTIRIKAETLREIYQREYEKLKTEFESVKNEFQRIKELAARG